MAIQWPNRILKRADSTPGGNVLLRLAEAPGRVTEMRRLIIDGQKPVVAFSGKLVEELGLQAARHHGLRQLSGEVAAFIVESELGAVRSSGSRKIFDDPVYTSATPFKLPDQARDAPAPERMATELLVRHLTDDRLAELARVISQEQARRANPTAAA